MYYRSAGAVPPKRHTQHRSRSGELHFEELMGEDGFTGNSSLLYHSHVPSAIVDTTAWALPDQSLTPNLPLLPRHFRTHELTTTGAEMVTGRRLLLGNDDVRLSYVAADTASPLYRNAIGDECVYLESGRARLETVFGPLECGTGDYLVIPRGTTHRWVPHGLVRAYIIEASSHITPPRRYLSRFGQFLEQAPYCERDVRPPSDPEPVTATEVPVHIKHRGPGGIGGTIHVYAQHPFDLVGWAGGLWPYAFNVSDFEPITGRVHQPPPVHQVFEGKNFVICNFVPRKVDYHPLSIPVPYFHSNVDSDEVLFYCGGDYAARKGSGIGQGSISLHPSGYPHGPQPGAYERSIGVEFFDELAVMVDTFRPLGLGEAGQATEDPAYAWTWAGGRRTPRQEP